MWKTKLTQIKRDGGSSIFLCIFLWCKHHKNVAAYVNTLYYVNFKRNDILTTIFWQLLDNFLSHTHMMLLSSLFLFLSPLFLTNKKWEKQGCQQSCHQMDVKISLLYILFTATVINIIKMKQLVKKWKIINSHPNTHLHI